MSMSPCQKGSESSTEFNCSFMQAEKVNKDQLLSDSEEFVCKICCEHVVGASPVLTRCSHLFCGDCFKQWAENCKILANCQIPHQSWAQKVRKPGQAEVTVPCPACDEILDMQADVDEVCKNSDESANLILWKVLWKNLYSLKVQCNNSQHKCGSCNWVGMYGEYHEHLDQCRNACIAVARDEEKAYSVKSTDSDSNGSTDIDNSNADFPCGRFFDSHDFSDSQDASDLHESCPDVGTPPVLDEDVEEKLADCSEPNPVPPIQVNSFACPFNTHWGIYTATGEKESCQGECTSVQGFSMDENEVPSNLMSLLAQIDEDDEKESTSNVMASAPEKPVAAKQTASPPLSPTSATAVLLQLKAEIDRRVRAATGSLAPSMVAEQQQQQQSLPSMAAEEIAPRCVLLDQLIVPQPAQQRIVGSMPRTKKSGQDPRKVLPQHVMRTNAHAHMAPPVPVSSRAFPPAAPAAPAPVFSAPVQDFPDAPATSPRLPPPPPGICAPPSAPPSLNMPCAPPPSQLVAEVCRAFQSIESSKISLLLGDLVEVYRQDPSGWAYGRKVNAAVKVQGWFPTWVFQH
eukprot:gnl/MRDRNA2_/MRDRNA2_103424_c0_seq1.p1 gnl/MRDRNA2_/MRDRNA2_103424_c0~~gnl/MRDRNA2_/MRDRNA2_103424_c0_seq1.p1  ORF type:complete len:572 (-),score=126.11 gnl/MRDRNA2_/MRDRNA2_103424_c0_seq1:611-2326(-)